MAQPRNYNGIDLVKFLCAILVFIIHIPPFSGEVSGMAERVNFWLQHGLCRLAVPFYFVSSGFFLYRKMPLDNLDTEVIRNYCFRLLRLVGIWYVLLFVGGDGQLWYLGATVVAVILLSLCFHLGIRPGIICALACLLYGIGLLGDSYNGLIAPLEKISVFRYLFRGYTLLFTTTRNGVFMGFLFVFMGAMFSKHTPRLTPRVSLAGFLGSMLCLSAEIFLLDRHDIPIEYNMYVFLLPATFFLFSFARAIPLKDHAVYGHLRSIGVLIYFSHLMVDWFVSLALRLITRLLGMDCNPFRFVLSLFATLLFAVCVQWLSRRETFRWINWLLS